MWEQVAYGQIWQVAQGHYGLVQRAFSPVGILTYYPHQGQPQQLAAGSMGERAIKAIAASHHQGQVVAGRALVVNGVAITGTVNALSTHTRLDGSADLEIRFTPDDAADIAAIIETMGVSQ